MENEAYKNNKLTRPNSGGITVCALANHVDFSINGVAGYLKYSMSGEQEVLNLSVCTLLHNTAFS